MRRGASTSKVLAVMSVLDEPLRFDAATLQASPGAARVTRVGAGPGDPDLHTVKAARALRTARLVLYDHLVAKDVRELVARTAALV